MMEKDNIDLHKTKQLAWVLFSLTERGLRDEIWTEEIADSAVVTRNLVEHCGGIMTASVQNSRIMG